jgi:hypothetical protein
VPRDGGEIDRWRSLLPRRGEGASGAPESKSAHRHAVKGDPGGSGLGPEHGTEAVEAGVRV